MPDTEPSNARQCGDRVDRLIEHVAGDIDSRALKHQAEQAAEWLVKNQPHCEWPDEKLVTILRNLLPRLRDWTTGGKVNVFFSYKAKDRSLAETIGRKLENWSDGRLKINHMADLGVDQVGRDWRAKIEETIPQCDGFLLLLPTPGDERDWVLYEAGYFSGAQGLAGRLGRLVCLHHPDNEVSDALGARQSVPAEVGSVRAFLEALFRSPDWIPGMPVLNPHLNQLDDKAAEIVRLIKPPPAPIVKYCCGAHMKVSFDDASAVRGWEQLARGRVIDGSNECMHLFGLQVAKDFFGEWVREVSEDERDRGWITQLARAVQAVGEGLQPPPIQAALCLADGRRVQPRICAVERRKTDKRVESIHILFDAEPPPATASMKPELAALSISLESAVRYRYQLLEPFANRKLELKDVLDFEGRRTALLRRAVRDRRFQDQSQVREGTLRAFVGEDKADIQKMYERADQLWPRDGVGEMDRAIANAIQTGDTEPLAGLVKELLDMTQRFLTVTSKRFAELIAGS